MPMVIRKIREMTWIHVLVFRLPVLYSNICQYIKKKNTTEKQLGILLVLDFFPRARECHKVHQAKCCPEITKPECVHL